MNEQWIVSRGLNKHGLRVDPHRHNRMATVIAILEDRPHAGSTLIKVRWDGDIDAINPCWLERVEPNADGPMWMWSI